MVANAFIKLSPIHRKLSELEITNIQDFFNSDFVPAHRRKQLSRLAAFVMTYIHAIRRTTTISRQARQDYYALQRQGCFVVKELPKEPLVKQLELSLGPVNSQTPILIIPGLNTPPVFFREMHDFLTRQGHPVFVLDLPAQGLADMQACMAALDAEIDRLTQQYQCPSVNVIGHCLGGLIAHHWLEMSDMTASGKIRHLISLGTGFLGAEGVQQLKNLWIPRNPGKPIPAIFDELIQANMNCIRHSSNVIRHNLLTVWDFMVHFRKGLLETTHDTINNHIIDDPDIDHLTIALHPRILNQINLLLTSPKSAA